MTEYDTKAGIMDILYDVDYLCECGACSKCKHYHVEYEECRRRAYADALYKRGIRFTKEKKND